MGRESKIRELEKEVEILQDAKTIAQEVITVQAERCYELQDNVDRLLACIAKEQKEKHAKSEFLCSQIFRAVLRIPFEHVHTPGDSFYPMTYSSTYDIASISQLPTLAL
ncbi:hypothetical protein AV530_000360 [Patagioenas fasciata monilis]|uniref:Uncharacterized protein n=1 Tax=Patagioenas fasciata monilis TaxID=372326 RepID=A0A1V4KA31_PATFA|nr:hypothetical protein AV530_000360 [Patagioenas fasciata monilis]